MPRLRVNDSPCSAAQALEVLGDRWTLLLIREVAFGTRRFDDFVAHLGIARNILSTRLNALTAADILVQVPVRDDALRMAYHLTEKGQDLLPVLIALLQWGDRWLQTPASIPVRLIERASGQVLEPMRPRNRSGKPLTLAELDWIPGPGSTDPRIAPLVAAYEKQRRIEPRPIPVFEKPKKGK
ncbi:MAG: transcriptional regulator [Massilia sp.]|jgi:DNA-binding HxlR family transcriptional regulator|nr:transcriptional regulator [Massilia sp.]MDB5948544.1 transcriptional regulator [Massilia sp.]